VASIIERIELGCASNLMRVLISLTAAYRGVPPPFYRVGVPAGLVILMHTNALEIFGLCYDSHWCRLNGDVDEYEVARCFVCSSGSAS